MTPSDAVLVTHCRSTKSVIDPDRCRRTPSEAMESLIRFSREATRNRSNQTAEWGRRTSADKSIRSWRVESRDTKSRSVYIIRYVLSEAVGNSGKFVPHCTGTSHIRRYVATSVPVRFGEPGSRIESGDFTSDGISLEGACADGRYKAGETHVPPLAEERTKDAIDSFPIQSPTLSARFSASRFTDASILQLHARVISAGGSVTFKQKSVCPTYIIRVFTEAEFRLV